MKIMKRVCIRDWFIEALNGDRLDLKYGERYTTSAGVIGGEVTVFSQFWVKAPISIFYEQQDTRDYILGME